MVQFCTGLPGSGKSYYGIFNISIHFAKDLKDNKKFKSYALDETNYKYCLTNINEIKLDKFENVISFKFDDFYQILKKLHSLYKLSYTDSQLEDEVKDEIFFNTLIVLDECHNYLGKDNEVLVWWLSYHRHFNQDIILITQDIPLVNKKYKSFTEFFYKALPSSKKLFNTSMIYQQFTGYQMFQTQKGNTKKLPIIKDIFTYYGSGANQKQKSLVLHFLLLALALLVFLFIAGYFYISSFEADEPIKEIKKVNTNANTKKVSIQNNKKSFNTDGTYYTMFCNKILCFINNNVYEKSYILHILQNQYKANFLLTHGNKYYFITNDKFNLFELKQRSTENEKSLSNSFDFDLFNSKSKEQ